MSSEIKKIDLQEKLYSIKANNPFEDFSYLRAMEQSNSASEKSGWIPDHLGEIKNKKLISFLLYIKNLIAMGNSFLIISGRMH
jgi:predicted N-acyltransferase